MKKVICREFDPKTGKSVPITMTPEELAEMREQVSKRFTKDGKDLGFLGMMSRLKPRSKPKSQPAA